jgi:hypothetical protein
MNAFFLIIEFQDLIKKIKKITIHLHSFFFQKSLNLIIPKKIVLIKLG